MKQCLFIFLFILPVFALCQQSYTIKAFLPGWEGGSVVVSKDDVRIGSGKILGDVFSFTSQLRTVGFATLHIRLRDRQLVFPFFIEPGTISIRAGSRFKLFAYGTALNNLYKDFEEETDSMAVALQTDPKKIKREKAAAVIRSNPASLLSLRLLKELFYLDNAASDSEYYSLYQLLSDSLKKTEAGKKIGEEVAVRYFTSPGKPAPVLTLTDLQDKPAPVFVPGKLTIVHFWASWCVPCKRELAELKKTISKYGDRNVQVVMVSLDKDTAAWRRSVEPASLNWQQLVDRKAFEGEAAKTFGVKNIPANFLIDSNGKMLARHINVTEIENLISEFHD